ncbi:facilitated trehalose transporter Tret1-2 homolog [Arctopsyche grandis]|uniref:facilitated trehalose transporter Tret1-2 homolog n=1 Tax=Arctopsyche grandis TaxID=121162 RepID=UPI00406D927E
MSMKNSLRSKKISVDQETVPKNLEPSLQNQIIATIICNLGAFATGAAIGWTSPSIGSLKKSGFLTEAEAAWSGGLFPLGGLASVPLFGYIANTKGRKPAAFLAGIPITIGLALKAWGNTSYWLLIGRFLCGLGGGAATALPPLYIGEISEPRARGLLSCFLMIENSLGLFYAYVLGAILPDIDLLPLTLLPLPIIFLLAFWFMPETPIFRLKRGHEEKAARALAWLRKLPLNSKEVKNELTQLATRLGLRLPLPPLPIKRPRRISRRKPQPIYMRSCSSPDSKKEQNFELEKLKAKAATATAKAKNEKSTMEKFKQLISSEAGRRGLGICFALVTTQTFTGMFAVSTYAVYIFETAGSAVSPNACAILYAIVIILGSICGSLLMDKAGRRMMQISSCLIIFICHLAIGFSLKSVANGEKGGILGWLPLIALPVCVFMFNAGAGNMPFVMLSEVFAAEVQDIANTIIMIFIWLTSFVLIQFFPLCASLIGLHNVFYVFAVVAFWSAVYAYFCLIETKGKTLEDILMELSNEKTKNSTEVFYDNLEKKSKDISQV